MIIQDSRMDETLLIQENSSSSSSCLFDKCKDDWCNDCGDGCKKDYKCSND